MKEGDITTDPTDIKRVIRGYEKELYSHKLDNLVKIDNFLKDTSYQYSLKRKWIT